MAMAAPARPAASSSALAKAKAKGKAEAKAPLAKRDSVGNPVAEGSKKWYCDVCAELCYRDTALINLPASCASYDWQGHLPIICKTCYAEDQVEEPMDDKEWHKMCKKMWPLALS